MEIFYKKVAFQSKMLDTTFFFKIRWLLTELWSKNRKISLYTCVMMLSHIISGFLIISHPKVVRFWKKIYVSNILDQNATFLLNNFFTLLSEKNLILQISLKSALEIFSILLFHTTLGVCYLAMVLSDLCLFKTPNTC